MMDEPVYYAVSYCELTSHYILVMRVFFRTMATTYGQIQEFFPEIESIEAYMYIKRVELYFEANNIDADRRVHGSIPQCD